MKILIKTLIISFLTISVSNAENKWSLYTGMFDFSDDGKRANFFGAEYINFNASKDIFLGNVKPVTGAMITADDALYISISFLPSSILFFTTIFILNAKSDWES